MKTFDESVDHVLEIMSTDDWHDNYCRCEEIEESRKIQSLAYDIPLHQIVMLNSMSLNFILHYAFCYGLEVGVAVGQEMEKP